MVENAELEIEVSEGVSRFYQKCVIYTILEQIYILLKFQIGKNFLYVVENLTLILKRPLRLTVVNNYHSSPANVHIDKLKDDFCMTSESFYIP